MTHRRVLMFVIAATAALAALCLPVFAGAQDPAGAAGQDPQGAEAGRKLLAELQRQFDAEKIAVDLRAQTVTIPVVMNAPPDPIEYLLIHRKGKKHEAMFYTHSKPSVLNGALLLLGLQPGQNASYKEKDPPPTLEEVEAGVDPLIITAPEGMEFWMTVRFQDIATGKQVEYCIEDLLYDLGAGTPIGATSWIYLGGRMASLYKGEEPVFVADFEGNLVSTCYLAPNNHLGTMKHERARDDQNWWLTTRCPAPGTEAEFVFHRHKPQLMQQREKRLAAERDNAKSERPGTDPPKNSRNGG